MKKIKFIVTFILGFTTLFSTIAYAEELKSDFETYDKYVEQEEYLEKQSMGIDIYKAVHKTLENNKDTYGGTYIDDNGNLNILVVNDNKVEQFGNSAELQSINDYQSYLDQFKSEEQNLVYRTVDYSLDYLENIQDVLYQNMDALGIKCLYVDVVNNKVIIGCGDEGNKDRIAEFIGNDDVLEYEKYEGVKKCYSTAMVNGSNVTTKENSFSMTCGAINEDGVGFITSGHCVSYEEDVYWKGSIVGFATQVIDNEIADFAFVRTVGGLGPKYTTMFSDGTKYTAGIVSKTNSARYVSGDFPVGTVVTKYGINGVSTGKIKSTNYSGIYDDNKKVKGRVLATCKSYPGDSGGAIKADYNSRSYCAGVISSSVNGSDYTVYTDMNVVKDEYVNKKKGYLYGYYDITTLKY